MSPSHNDVWSDVNNPNNPASFDDWADCNNPNNPNYIEEDSDSDEDYDDAKKSFSSNQPTSIYPSSNYYGYRGEVTKTSEGLWSATISDGIHSITSDRAFNSIEKCIFYMETKYPDCIVDEPPIVFEIIVDLGAGQLLAELYCLI